MNPFQMAHEKCAGYVTGIGCASPPEGCEEGVCVLEKMTARCAYFENCVLPLCARSEAYRMPKQDKKTGKFLVHDKPESCRIRYAGVRGQYRGMVVTLTKGEETIPETMAESNGAACAEPGCKRPRGTGHRYCDQCAARRRRDATTLRVRKLRAAI